MTKYLIRRLLQAIPLLFLISILLFTILQLQPVKPWDLLLHRPNLSPEARHHILAYYGFDKPVWMQYLIWVGNLLPFQLSPPFVKTPDLGTSYFTHESTLYEIFNTHRLENTVVLMGTAYLLTLVIAIPVGIIAAVRQYSRFDNLVTGFAFLGFSLPNFWFGLMLIIAFAVVPYEHFGFKLFPSSGMASEIGSSTGFGLVLANPLDVAWHVVLPAVVLAVQFIAAYSRFIRGAMLEVLNQDFIRTARAKGLGERTVVLRHAFRNALLPLITLMGLDIPRLFVGALVTEQVFAWPGMGRFFWESANRVDYQVLMGILVMLSVLVVLGNLVADLAYGWADPRIQYR